ncbi:MAG: hypothetical protein ACHQPI_01080 [Thermoanaerobaculia bacterium]
MKGTLKRCFLGLVATVLVLTVGAASAQGLWYKEVERDGRIYVFNTAKKLDAWQKSGDMGVAITLVGHGPNGETVVAENEMAIDLYNLKHDRPPYNRPPAPKPSAAEESSPLQFKIGSATIQPLGFMDFTGMYRSTDVGSGIGTNFGSIPYGTTSYQGNLSETRFSMQNSRVGFRVDADVKSSHVMGYMEADFLGNNGGNVAVSTNSNTFRSRLFFVDLRNHDFEIALGQLWSLVTPGRTGISTLPGDLFYTQVIDVNYQAGLFFGRIPELRFVYHPSNQVALALALDSPEQYVGGSAGGSLVTFPAALSNYPGGQLNNGSTTLGVPNQVPDVIVKVAFDPSRRFHIELGGVGREFKVYNTNDGSNYTATGGGAFLNFNVELVKNFRLIAAGFISDGGGRYIFGQAPDVIARADGSLSPVKSRSTVSGFEYNDGITQLYAYYGGIAVDQNVTMDTNGKLVGYGYDGSPSGQNRTIQEGTIGFSQTFWKDAKYGSLALMGQYSYLSRIPWYIPSGSPSDAHLNMVYLNVRYTLPGAAPAMGIK